MDKTCEDCTHFLTCKKIQDLQNLPTICKKFEVNFPMEEKEEIVEDVEYFEELKEPIMHICNKAGICPVAANCPHGKPHEVEFEMDCNTIENPCEDVNLQLTKCIPV
jgi:hypothetical protein